MEKLSLPEHEHVYVSGPMTGYPDHNFAAFRVTTAELRERGFVVTSPAELDEEAAAQMGVEEAEAGWEEFLRRDLKLVVDVDAIVTLEGWQKSRGAKLEVFVGHALGKPIFRVGTFERIPIGELERPPATGTVLEEAASLVDGDRGANYGHPADDFGRTAQIVTAILGVEVRVDQVPLIMMAVKLSRHTNKPQRDNLVDIAGYARTAEMVAERIGGYAVHK